MGLCLKEKSSVMDIEHLELRNQVFDPGLGDPSNTGLGRSIDSIYFSSPAPEIEGSHFIAADALQLYPRPVYGGSIGREVFASDSLL